MKRLVISEKPNLARTVALGIQESFQKHDGYLESEHYLVTWGFGHLFGLIDIEEYQPDYDASKKYRWTLDNLPFYPEKFQFALKKNKKEVDAGVKKQFTIIKKLLKRPDVECVIHNGDADREGEVIVRLILQHAGYRGKVLRLWEDDQTPGTLGKAIRYQLHNDSDYDQIAEEGFARTYIDWLYGINLTRYVSLKSGTLLRVGRVINAIVKTIYDRDMEIKDFKPENYYVVSGQAETGGETVKITCKGRYPDQREAEKARDLFQKEQVVVDDVKKEQKEIAPGKLFSITKLQNVMGKNYKMSPDVTLSALQKLYEKGYVTYPRTSSEYLAEGDKKEVEKVLSLLQEKGYSVKMKEKKTIFDSSKVESHGALRPTKSLPDSENFPEAEKLVYQTILARFLSIFCSEPCLAAQTTITIKVGDEIFQIKGMVLLQKGWQQYETSGKKDKLLPNLKKGQILLMEFFCEKRTTTPPKHYTVATLNNFLENPFRKKRSFQSEEEEEEGNEEHLDDTEEYRAIMSGLQIGTGATRAPIIGNAIQCGYISLQKDVYQIEKKGIYMVETLKKLNIQIDKKKTAEFGAALKKVSKGEMTVDECVALCRKDIDQCFSGRDIEIDQLNGSNRVSLGKCPVCGKEVYENQRSFGCSGYRDGCDFAVWKNDKYLAKIHKVPTASMVEKLLKEGQIRIKTGNRGKKALVSTLRYVKKDNGYWGWERVKK